MLAITTIGLDIAKSVFRVPGTTRPSQSFWSSASPSPARGGIYSVAAGCWKPNSTTLIAHDERIGGESWAASTSANRRPTNSGGDTPQRSIWAEILGLARRCLSSLVARSARYLCSDVRHWPLALTQLFGERRSSASTNCAWLSKT
jgi:hypothetical protein